MREAWCVKRDAWCVLHDSTCTSKSDAWCGKVIFAEGATQCGSLVAFLHTGTCHLIYLNINVSTFIASAILSQMFSIRMLSLYSFNKVLYSAPDTYHQSHHYISITIKAAQIREEDYVIYKWVSTWLSLDHMQGSWGVPGRIHKMTSW